MKSKKMTQILLGLVLMIWGFNLYNYAKPEVITIIEQRIVVRNVGVSLEDKIEDLKESLLDDLLHEEIKGHKNRSLVIVFDPLQKDLAKCRQVGGVRLYCYSIGDFNFKTATIQHYYLKLFGIVLTDKEAMLIAMDSELSRELAKKIIFEQSGGIYAWANSAKKINAVNRVSFIKNLEK